MANARQAQLIEQRRASGGLYPSSGRIRILAPANNSIASIAKKTATSELNTMVSRYNNGEIGNQDMKDFLNKMIGTPGLSDADKLEVETQLKEFDSRIEKDRLEIVYKSAPDNSLAQIQAGQALSNYYRGKAASQVPGSPAHTTNIENAIAYEGKVTQVKENIQKIGRQNLRYQEEAKVNAIRTGTSENANAKAEMWKKLAEQAAADGDVTDYNKYAAYYEKEVTNASTLAEKETSTTNKKQLNDYINGTLNDYKDGKISGDQALLNLQEAEKFAADTGDTSTQLRLNNLYTSITRDIDKGITYGNNGAFGDKLKTVTEGSDVYLNPDGSVSYGGGTTSTKKVGSGGKSSGGGTTSSAKVTPGSKVGGSGDRAKSFTELDQEYKNELNKANQALINGEVSVNGKKVKYDGNDYTQSVLLLSRARQADLESIVSGLEEIVAVNPNAKLGKTKVQTLIDKYSPELDKVKFEHNQVRSGNLVLSFDGKKVGLVPKATVEGFVQDSTGVYHKPRKGAIDFNTEEQAKQFIKANKLPKDSYSQDETTGKYFIERTYLDVTDTNGNTITYEYDPNLGYLPVIKGDPLKDTVARDLKTLRDSMSKDAEEAIKAGKIPSGKVRNAQQLQNYIEELQTDQPPSPVLPSGFKSPLAGTTNAEPGVLEKAQQAVDTIAKPVSETISKVIAPIVPKPQYQTSEELNLPSNQPLSTPSSPAPKFNPTPANLQGGTTLPQTKQPVLKLATQTPTPVAKAAPALKSVAQQSNIKPVNLGTQISKPAAPQQSLSPIDFFKKLLKIK